MFALIALICVLDGSTRGHHCDTKVYTEGSRVRHSVMRLG
jgi:hypothetical protein